MFDYLNLRKFIKAACLLSIQRLVIKKIGKQLPLLSNIFYSKAYNNFVEGKKQAVDDVEKTHGLKK